MSESIALAVQSQQGTAVAQGGGGLAWSPDQVALLKRTVAEGTSDDELQLFLHVCKHTGLDPFAKQIYCIVRDTWNPRTRQKEPRMTIQTGIDGFRLTAARTGQLAGISDPEFGSLVHGRPEWARVVVKRRMADGYVAEFAHTVYWSEYVQTKQGGEPTDMWARMPRNQLGKCAESGALRKGFPAELSGVYTDDEMAQASNRVAEGDAPEVQQGVVMATDAQIAELRELADRIHPSTRADLERKVEAGIPASAVMGVWQALDKLRQQKEAREAKKRGKPAESPPQGSAEPVDPDADPLEAIYGGMD